MTDASNTAALAADDGVERRSAPPANGRLRMTLHSVTRFARWVSGGRPRRLVILATVGVFAAAYGLAFLMRFDFTIPGQYTSYLIYTLPFAVLIKLLTFGALGVLRIAWAHISLRDALRVLRATAFASGVIAASNLLFLPHLLIPRSIFIGDGVLTFLGVSGLFGVLRLAREIRNAPVHDEREREPIFIVGAGDAGNMLLSELTRSAHSAVQVVGFLDDDRTKHGTSSRGVRVLGKVADAGHYARMRGVHRAYVAMPSVSGAAMRQIVKQLTDAGLAIRVLGPIESFLGTRTLASRLREVSIEDLLRRDPIGLDAEAIRSLLADKRVLVTGAAGSIGSELCRQVMRVGPSSLIALDCAESPLYDLMLEFPHRAVPELVDVTDKAAVARVFEQHQPQVVFHAAAVKHVPMLEHHPVRAIEVNVVGTRIVAEAARGHAEAFVMISTDKAVRPSSVMGASKRVAERVVRGMASTPRGTRFVSVRFGNVLGSNGSVVPIFKRQIARGGPVTVTHPDMRRYFITIPEAVQLLIEAAALGQGGEVFVLDMGQQVRIVDLAEDIIRLSGLRPGEDIQIEFTGVRPGEKLYEEWVMDSETHAPTSHPSVFRLSSPDPGLKSITALEAAGASRPAIVAALGALVEDYVPPSPSASSSPDDIPTEHRALTEHSSRRRGRTTQPMSGK